jgi:nitrite reductase/ring-hydroxylating ferredoxin subunit
MEWIKIFSGADEAKQRLVSDHPQLVTVGKTRICLVRRGELFFAVQDSCSHNGESLSGGKINYLGEVVCPWHGYRFDLSTGRATDSSCADLKTYPIKFDETGFFIGI